MPPVMEAQSLNHWTAREAQRLKCFKFLFCLCDVLLDFPGGSDGEESACTAGDPGLIPGLGRFPGEETGNPLQYSYLENSMDRGAWWAPDQAPVHGVAELDTTEQPSM